MFYDLLCDLAELYLNTLWFVVLKLTNLSNFKIIFIRDIETLLELKMIFISDIQCM